jgi:hypothetical protein
MQSGISLIFRLGPVMVVPFFARHRNYTSQHYNTHAHSARATKHILQQNNTEVMQWPALHLELNPLIICEIRFKMT